jgi:CreA protein
VARVRAGDNGGPARDFVAARVRELAELLDGLGADDLALDRAWHAAVAGSVAQQATGITSPAARAAPRTAGAPAGELQFRGGLSCTVTVSSLPDAIAWYESRLGWSVVASIPDFGWAELATDTPGVRVGLSEIPSPGVTGGAVLNFGVADVEAARARLEAGGVSFDGPTREIAGMTRLAAFRDPDGNRLMLHDG